MQAKILRVDLTSGSVKDEIIPEEICRKFVGGRGLAEKILWDELKPGIDPLSPENILIFMTGPLEGTRMPTSGRFHVVTKSPQTGGIGDSNCGGDFGPKLRAAGYDGVVVTGRAEKPVYIWIDNGKVEIRDASHLWGRGVWDTEDMIMEEIGDKKISIASIGPAGENKVMFAAIMNRKHRAAGRTGVGAVMGSKNLKAIAVRGDREPEVADEDKVREVSKKMIEILRKQDLTGQGLPTYGTASLVDVINEAGIFPTRNFQTGVFEGAEKINAETINKTILEKNIACWGCPIACGRKTKVTAVPYQVDGEGPEYETDWSLGAMCGIDDLNAITYAHNLCDDLGMDPISLGSTIACAMELNERGLIPKEKLYGLELKFGNPQAIVELAWKTAYLDGFGKEIAMGAKRLAEKYGAPELAMHSKGLELPAYDPRGAKGHGLGYATSNRGGCHLRAYMISPEILGLPEPMDRFDTKGKAQAVIEFQNLFAMVDSMIVCKFVTFALGAPELTEMLNAVTGWNFTVEEFMKTGERIYNLERMIINREGFSAKDDTLPKRLLEEPMPEGPSKGHVVELEKMLPEYYELRGWKDGVVTEEKKKELGL
ncbi:MAG: aldehyde:ferredoxin oxidoreductase [Archaeoglobi archaeon]|nr:aldehyde ferredoxin oxidoreductase family protein [Candidatus Mnemosynella bozhongmuii]MDI3502637.1 aldehyde:ferredoxin oxidoreductase [Archaeoglobi archaeon]MDK2781580.1 aldehyde:ferredoxin oxidoreductase [Archaeoglobi archaeon]